MRKYLRFVLRTLSIQTVTINYSYMNIFSYEPKLNKIVSSTTLLINAHKLVMCQECRYVTT